MALLVTHCSSLPNTAYCLLSAFLGVTCMLFGAASNKNDLYCFVHPIVQVLCQYEHSKHVKTEKITESVIISVFLYS
jgi:hypothetical protein